MFPPITTLLNACTSYTISTYSSIFFGTGGLGTKRQMEADDDMWYTDPKPFCPCRWARLLLSKLV